MNLILYLRNIGRLLFSPVSFFKKTKKDKDYWKAASFIAPIVFLTYILAFFGIWSEKSFLFALLSIIFVLAFIVFAIVVGIYLIHHLLFIPFGSKQPIYRTAQVFLYSKAIFWIATIVLVLSILPDNKTITITGWIIYILLILYSILLFILGSTILHKIPWKRALLIVIIIEIVGNTPDLIRILGGY